MPGLASRAPDRHAIRRRGSWLLGTVAANAGGAVYGAMMVAVLIVAEDTRRDGYPATIEAAAIVLVLYWLTNFYTHALGERLRRREPVNARLLWQSCLHELPVVEGALIPVLVLLVTWAAGFTVARGANLALWAAAASIVVLEIVAGWRARNGPSGVWFEAAAGTVIGLTLVGLKLVL